MGLWRVGGLQSQLNFHNSTLTMFINFFFFFHRNPVSKSSRPATKILRLKKKVPRNLARTSPSPSSHPQLLEPARSAAPLPKPRRQPH